MNDTRFRKNWCFQKPRCNSAWFSNLVTEKEKKMKKIILALGALLFVNTAMAGDFIESDALAALVRLNPTATSKEGTDIKVAELIAGNMLSYFSEHGVGTLTVSTNDCGINQKTGNIDCQLTLFSSDRKISKSGAFTPTPDMTESSLMINFSITLDFKSVVGPVTYQIAG